MHQLTNKNYYAVIMAGGIGSRFWPVSTTEFPKQFHDMLGSGQTLLQKTFARLEGLIPTNNINILTNDKYIDIVLEQLPIVQKSQVVLEPAMRNTAPCILLSALKIQKIDPNAMMIVAPSDHWIEDEISFLKDVEIGFKACATTSKLLTLGIKPTFPNTGFGYIEYNKEEIETIKKVNQFREKPNYEAAKQFLADGNFLWNAGIFIWSAESIVNSFKENLPEMYELFSSGIEKLNTAEERNFILNNYEKSENISIDYGILEKSNAVYVKKASFDWNDLGTWGALHDKLEKDKNNNALVRAIPQFNGATGNMVFTSKNKLVVIDGIKDYIVVDKEDVLMIYPKEKEQEIKSLLAAVKQKFNNKYS
ncbi:MAG: mannose-1-phosphate guanylyltransferase [Flavobacteriaceae bacterium]|nr:mannose-1-phosphate guanylyltransferase [Flavobacteriaceae bacterium]